MSGLYDHWGKDIYENKTKQNKAKQTTISNHFMATGNILDNWKECKKTIISLIRNSSRAKREETVNFLLLLDQNF